MEDMCGIDSSLIVDIENKPKYFRHRRQQPFPSRHSTFLQVRDISSLDIVSCYVPSLNLPLRIPCGLYVTIFLSLRYSTPGILLCIKGKWGLQESLGWLPRTCSLLHVLRGKIPLLTSLHAQNWIRTFAKAPFLDNRRSCCHVFCVLLKQHTSIRPT